MNIKHLFLASFVMFITGLGAQPVSDAEALETASGFLKKQQKGFTNLHLTHINVDGKPAAKLIRSDEKGFVLIATDKRLKPVIGFSFKNDLDPQHIPPALKSWLRTFTNSPAINQPAHSGWDRLKDAVTKDSRSFPEVPVLISAVWNQSWPYNAHCPEHPNGSNGRCLAGCVATAMAQVMYYWQYPATGNGSKTYFWGNDSTVNFGQTTYDWPAMGNYSNAMNRDEIAQIIFHSAVSVDMNFGPSASGSSISKSADALKDYFRFMPTLQYHERQFYNYESWKQLMQNELLGQRPVLYAGIDSTQGGHAFVLDGFRDSCYFHFNWGWGGHGNGYFHLNNMAATGGNFAINQRAVTGIIPYGANYCGDYWFTAGDQEIDDGSGYSLYQNNSSCTYLVEHPADAPLNLQFTKWDLADAGDKLTIYDGVDETAPVLASFDGTHNPGALTSGSRSVFIKFETDGSGQASGWKLNITTTSTNIANRQQSKIFVAPNPATDVINVSGLKQGKLELFSLDGRKIISRVVTQPANSHLDVSALPQGFYILSVTTEDGARNTTKVVVQR